MELIPLQRSAEFDEVESELKALFLSIYKKRLSAKVEELMLAPMPNLGGDEAISRALNNDGLAMLRNTASENIRYLFHAWRYRNPQRGTKFLDVYLRSLFGSVFTIAQLWCRKDGVYPVDVMSDQEIRHAGEDFANFFLTSRLRVDIETEIVPERILRAARTAVASRFVLELRAARSTLSTYKIGIIAQTVSVIRTSGTALYNQPTVEAEITVGPATVFGGSALTFSTSGRDTQNHLL